MEESEPQLAPVSANQYVIFEVARVEEAAAPPLAEVKEQAEAAWRRAQGAKLARETADRVIKEVRGKTDLAAALAAENKPGLEREVIDLERRELLARRQGNVPPPLVLLFSMAEGSVKLLEAPRDIGWYVISLDDITTSPVDEEPGLLEQTRRQLAPTLTEEYRRQAAAAMRKELGSTRNDAAIEAVRKQLAGEQ